jgi:hypothetical protein
MTEKQRLQTAARQQRFRERQAQSRRREQLGKGLPALPSIPSIPGQARWRAMIEQAQRLLCEAADEMQSYHDDRSEEWQEGPRAEELLARLEHLQQTLSQLQDAE